MNEFTLSWLAGMGIICWRSVRDQHGPPWPGQLLVASGLFVILAVVADAGDSARRLASLLGWGFNLAAFMNIAGGVTLPGQKAEAGWWAKVTQTTISPHSILPQQRIADTDSLSAGTTPAEDISAGSGAAGASAGTGAGASQVGDGSALTPPASLPPLQVPAGSPTSLFPAVTPKPNATTLPETGPSNGALPNVL